MTLRTMTVKQYLYQSLSIISFKVSILMLLFFSFFLFIGLSWFSSTCSLLTQHLWYVPWMLLCFMYSSFTSFDPIQRGLCTILDFINVISLNDKTYLNTNYSKHMLDSHLVDKNSGSLDTWQLNAAQKQASHNTRNSFIT